MSRSDLPFRSRLMSRVALVALLSGLAAGCSSGVERFGAPIYTGGTQNQVDILGAPATQPSYESLPPVTYGGPSTGSLSNSQVSRGVLPPVGGNARGNGVPIVSAQAPQPVPFYTGSVGNQVTSAPKTPVYTSLPEPTRTKSGWSAIGGSTVTLGSGESVASTSKRYGVPVRAIQSVNNLSGDPNLIRSGQRLVIPTYSQGSTVPRNALVQPSTPSTRVVSTTPVVPNKRPSAVSVTPVRTKTVRVASNDVVVPDSKPRQPRIASLSPMTATAAAPAITAVESTAPKRKPASTMSAAPHRTAKPTPKKPASVASRTPRREAAPEAPVESRVSNLPPAFAPTQGSVEAAPSGDSSSNRFRWPVRGRVISNFGHKPGGARNDGINLAVPEGAQIRSVESGTVIYAGNELKGYGNLVLIRHEDGWVSAYAHNSELNVRRGDTVRRGDIVAKAGSTGSVSQPQLHFELRRGNKPVDPMQYLSKV